MEWIKCSEQMPEEHKYESDNLQGHHEWTESDRVLAWDSMYGPAMDKERKVEVRADWRLSAPGCSRNSCMDADTRI